MRGKSNGPRPVHISASGCHTLQFVCAVLHENGRQAGIEFGYVTPDPSGAEIDTWLNSRGAREVLAQ
jgi:hypothetical protein